MEDQKPIIVCALYADVVESEIIARCPKQCMEFDATSLLNKGVEYVFNETDLEDVELEIVEDQKPMIVCALYAAEPDFKWTGKCRRSRIIGRGPNRRLELDATSLWDKKRRYMFNETDLEDVEFKVYFNSHRTEDAREICEE